jgi:flagellar protein FliS
MNRGMNRQYGQVQIKTANKGQLVVMLYRGAIKHMRKSLVQLEARDLEGKGKSLVRAQDIVLELLYALDQKLIEEGNELAQNLQRLYLYAYRRLVYANIHLDPDPIEEVIVLLANLLEAWEKVAVGNQSPDSDGRPAPGLALTG